MAKSQGTKKTRHYWTDAEKEALIIEVAHLPKGTVYPFFRKRHISSTWFRKTKAQYMAAHPEFQIPILPPAVPVTTMKREDAFNFMLADNDAKRRMLIEYNKLPVREKQAWREKHHASQANTSFYNRKLFKDKVGRGPIPAKHTPEEMVPLVAEYNQMTTGKKEWLLKHGLNHQNIFEYRKRVAKMQSNGNLPAVVPVVRRTTTHRTVHTPPPTPGPLAMLPSLIDGVNYLTIKRDMYSEIIEDLQRVLRGQK